MQSAGAAPPPRSRIIRAVSLGPTRCPSESDVFACLLRGFSPPSACGRERPYLPPEVEQALARQKIPGTSLSVFVGKWAATSRW